MRSNRRPHPARRVGRAGRTASSRRPFPRGRGSAKPPRAEACGSTAISTRPGAGGDGDGFTQDRRRGAHLPPRPVGVRGATRPGRAGAERGAAVRRVGGVRRRRPDRLPARHPADRRHVGASLVVLRAHPGVPARTGRPRRLARPPRSGPPPASAACAPPPRPGRGRGRRRRSPTTGGESGSSCPVACGCGWCGGRGRGGRGGGCGTGGRGRGRCSRRGRADSAWSARRARARPSSW
jgi:hypothetical protein